MRLFKAMVLGVLLLSSIMGRGTFHIHGSYDTDSDGRFETLVLNGRTSVSYTHLTLPTKA